MRFSGVRAFSLLEILVAVTVLIVLGSLTYQVSLIMIERSRAANCLGQLRQLGVAMGLYLADNNMVMPTMVAARSSKTEDEPAVDTVLAAYVGNPEAFRCPTDRRFYEETGTSYYWNVTLNGQATAALNMLNLIEDASRIPLLADKEGWHRYTANKVNILFADGHASQDVKFFTD